VRKTRLLTLLIALFLSSCQLIKGVGGYKPPGLPLKVTVDTTGEINFELEPEVEYPTPLGTFSVGVVIDPTEYFRKDSTLTVRIDCEEKFYDLHGQDFSIDFDSGYYEKVNLTKRGTDILLNLRRIGSNQSDCPVPLAIVEKTDGLLAAIKQRGYILIATDPNYEPQSFLNTNGIRLSDTKCPAEALTIAEMQGFDVDVANRIGNLLGVEACFVTPAWDTITAGNWADKWDISVGSMTILIARQKVLYFTIPYYYIPAVVAVRSDTNFTTISSLADQSLCVAIATTYESWLNSTEFDIPNSAIYSQPPSGIRIVSLATDNECAQKLASGQADFMGYVTAENIVDAKIDNGLPVKKIGKPVFSENLAVAIDRSHSLDPRSLVSEIDQVIRIMHQNGTLKELSIKWFGIDLTQDPNQ